MAKKQAFTHDLNARMTEYYNAEGDLVEARPSTADEMQMNLFAMNRADSDEYRDAVNQ